MLQLIIDGKQAALPPDLEIEIRLNNFILEERKEDTTYPLTLSLEANRHIFGYPDRINSNNYKTEYPAMVLCDGFLQLDGNAVVTDISGMDDEIELFIITDNRSFWGVNSGKYIDEINLGSERWPDGMYNSFSHSVYGGEAYVCVPMYDPDYNASSYIPVYYNRWDAARQELMKNWNGRQNTYVPFPRLLLVIEWIINACGYTVKINALEKIEGFRDVLIVHRRSVSAVSSLLNYKDIVPHLTVKEFFDEIERKFAVRLFIREGSKSVSIRSAANIYTISTDLTVYDGVIKTIEDSEDIKKNYKFLDKVISDSYTNQFRNDLQYLFGEDDEPETIECISTIVGYFKQTERIYMDDNDPDGDHATDIILEYELLGINKPTHENTEFRLTVYRGLKNRAISGLDENVMEIYGSVPIASPIPLADCPNPVSLLWTGANGFFELYHKARVTFVSSSAQTHEIQAVPSINSLANAQQLFTGNIIAHYQRYIIRSQSLKLSSDGVIEHMLTVHPL